MDYGSLREHNIERNKKFLQDIGLDGADDSKLLKVISSRPKRKRTQDRIEIAPERRSLRIADLPAPSYKVLIFANSC